jgi:hypothetical protein
MLTPKSKFPHRRNKNFGYDSFCATCFVTVGSEQNEALLAPLEAIHVCRPASLHPMSKNVSFLLRYDRAGSPE